MRENEASDDGIDPDSMFDDKSKNATELSSDNDAGSVPYSLLLCRSTLVSAGREAIATQSPATKALLAMERDLRSSTYTFGILVRRHTSSNKTIRLNHGQGRTEVE